MLKNKVASLVGFALIIMGLIFVEMNVLSFFVNMLFIISGGCVLSINLFQLGILSNTIVVDEVENDVPMVIYELPQKSIPYQSYSNSYAQKRVA